MNNLPSADYEQNAVIDLNRFYPSNLKNDFIDGLNETIFNRFFTKQDYDRVIGAIGENDLTSSIKNILEASRFATDNQIQPVLSASTETENMFLTWQDFLRRLKQQDVDVENYANWGAVTQFNWVPPIDLDKFVNFRDYYWDTTIQGILEPDYVTVKSRNVSRNLRLQQLIKSTADIVLNDDKVMVFSAASKIISVSGNIPSTYPVGLDVIIKYVNGTYEMSKVVASNFNITTSTTDITLTSLSEKDVYSVIPTRISATRNANDDFSIRVLGNDLTQLFTPEYIFSATNNANVEYYTKVITSNYDPTTNSTIVNVKNALPSDILSISIAPSLLLVVYELSYEAGYFLPSEYTIESFYKILWMVKQNKISSSSGAISSASNSITDSTVDFVAANVLGGDIIEIVAPNGVVMTGTVAAVTTNSLEFVTVDTPYMFSFSNVEYVVYTKRGTVDFTNEPSSPMDDTIWLDASTDTVKIATTGNWEIKAVNYTILHESIKDRKIIYADNAWLLSNSWIHKSQISEVAGKIRAQLPIIEFDDTLQLSDMSRVTHDWSYRSSAEVSYVQSSDAPTLFELFNIQQVNVDVAEFNFVDKNTIVFASKYGNMASEIKIGNKIVLSNFNDNDGIYEIVSATYEQRTPPLSNKHTIVKIKEDLSSLEDVPIGAKIAPLLTSKGDPFISGIVNWRYDGIDNVTSTSEAPEKNDLHDVVLKSSSISKSGYNWQSFSFVTGGAVDPILQFDNLLHSHVLYDDYGEGDIRVYINKKRQYGNFVELPSYIDDRYVGGIKFINGVQLTERDVVLVEVGAYSTIDAGRNSVIVNTPSGYELVNLSRYKKQEQIKTETSQPPEFSVVDSLTNELYYKSSKIFSYVEDLSQPTNRFIGKKLALKNSVGGASFVFEQHLLDQDKTLAYSFITANEIETRTIWWVGTNKEKFVPFKNSEGDWNIPNNWYYNMHHENRKQNSYLDLFTHFNSIIRSQKQPGLPADIANSYHADARLNFGLGGTIKEHNGNFDILAAAIFNDNVTVEELINFAKTQYASSLHKINSIYFDAISAALWEPASNATELIDGITQRVITAYESDSKYSYWFGDSSSYDGTDGVRNWPLTLPTMGMVAPTQPYSLIDVPISLFQIIHHDGHRSNVNISPALLEQTLSKILVGKQFLSDTVIVDTQSFPTRINSRDVINGDILVRTNTAEQTKTLYRYNGTTWERISLVETLLKCILEVEKRLYNVAKKKFKKLIYDFSVVEENKLYQTMLRKQFDLFAASSNVIAPLSNQDRFSQNNPFTWNYFSSVPSLLPTTDPFVPSADWRQLYNNMFGTPYPNLEPWRVQGFRSEPAWWSTTYVVDKKFIPEMWNNILAGIVPPGELLPDGTVSTGTQQLMPYTYLPVVTIPSTEDGFEYGDLLPPYWNAANNGGVNTIRSLFDPNTGDDIIAPSLGFIFGQNGDFEYEWKVSLDYNYDKMIVAFKLDPMNLVSNAFGYAKYTSGYLELHAHNRNIQPGNDVIFHGENVNGSMFEVIGMNQWYASYNRYKDYDFDNTKFTAVWKNSLLKPSYLFNSVIDSKSLDVRSDTFDLTDKDYNVPLKSTKKMDIKRIDAINLTLLSIPSKFLGDVDVGWTIELSTIPTNKNEIKFFGVQNYDVGIVGDVFTVGSDGLVDIGYTPAVDLIKINYNSVLTLDTTLGFVTSATHSVLVEINGVAYNLSVTQNDASTVGELLNVLNAQLSSAGSFELELGNVLLKASSPLSVLSITSDTVFSAISGFVSIGEQTKLDAQFKNVLRVKGNKTTKYLPLEHLIVTESSLFNGSYSIISTSYEPATNLTSIQVAETVLLPNEGLVIDGNIALTTELGIPESWNTGAEIYFNSYSAISGISLERPYYIIRLNAMSFAIADSPSAAQSGVRLPLSSIGTPDSLRAGKLTQTFKALDGVQTRINWRIHAIDDRRVLNIYDGASVTGMQGIVDWLVGYSAFAESIGFGLSNVRIDQDTGRPFSWELFIEKFIDWAFSVRQARQQTRIEYDVKANPADDSFTFIDATVPSWASGTAITFALGVDGTLPTPFVDSSTVNIPYYIVRTTGNTSVKLAASGYNASKGIFIRFDDASTGNIVMQAYEKFENRQTYTFAPFTDFLSLTHNSGITSNVFESDSYIYATNGNRMDSSLLFIDRRDLITKISLLDSIRNYNANNPSRAIMIGGAKISTQSIEHILSFNNYTVGGDLIYDAFLGLKTPRFLVEFGRAKKSTLRPTIGGLVVNNDKLIQNIEAAVDDSRYYYDDIKAEEAKLTTDIVRRTLGYDGPKTYMTDIGVGKKSQFLFWKSMIQNKGTNLAIAAFTNQVGLSGAEIDECWAYRIADFGGNQRLSYPEMKLVTSDANKNELRLEFIPPNNTVLDPTFAPVMLTDITRWWDQPDQMAAMAPFDTFFFDVKVSSITKNAETKLINVRNKNLVALPVIADSVIVTYRDTSDNVVVLHEKSGYEFINSMLISLTTPQDPTTLTDLTVATLTYDFESQNPSKIIDRKNEVVTANVPFWNPAIGQYDLNFVLPIDEMSPRDPASYTDDLSSIMGQSRNHWMGDKTGYIWMDTRKEGYVPYFDRGVMPNIDDRIFNWGKQADWADIQIYEWTKSKFPPDQWDIIAARHNNDLTIPDSERISGTPRKILYKNVSDDPLTPLWVEEIEQHVDVMAGLMNADTTPALYGDIDVYVNGRFEYTKNMTVPEDYLFAQDALPLGTYMRFIKPAHAPTSDELASGLYKFATPFTRESRTNPSSGNDEHIYYFWVTNKTNKIIRGGREYTLSSIKNGFLNAQSPYMILQGLREPGAGYGLIYGNVYDEFGFSLPHRYTQLIIKNLAGQIKDDDRYTLRFTKDFNLRDTIDQSGHLKKNVHSEWKIFREKQFDKVDRFLWNKLLESLIGHKMRGDSDFDANVNLPSLNRIVYDNINDTATRIGIGDGQIFTDGEMARTTIQTVIDRYIFDSVNRSAKDVLQEIDYTTPESTIRTLNNVYAILDAKYVNMIFFSALHDAMSLKKEYADILKTSWVALQISQNITIPTNTIKLIEHNLVPDLAA